LAIDRTFPHGASVRTKNIRFNPRSRDIEAAIASQELALTSLFLVEGDLAAGPLVRLFATELRVGTDFYIASPREPRHAASVAAVMAWLVLAAVRGTCAVAPTRQRTAGLRQSSGRSG
jgi:LysR family transcriptional regulator, glycine cleavage system transcriptional activator